MTGRKVNIMFEYVVVIMDGSTPDIYKCRGWSEVKETVMDAITNDSDDIESEYLEEVADNIRSDWDYCPGSVNDWVESKLEDSDWLRERGIYIE